MKNRSIAAATVFAAFGLAALAPLAAAAQGAPPSYAVPAPPPPGPPPSYASGPRQEQIRGTIITVFVTVTIGVLKVFDVVYVTTGGNFNTDVLGNQFWTQISTFFNYGAASAIVVIMMAALIPIMWYQVRHFRAEEAA